MTPARQPLSPRPRPATRPWSPAFGLLIFRLARASAWRLGRSLSRAAGCDGPSSPSSTTSTRRARSPSKSWRCALRIKPSNLVALLDQLEDRRAPRSRSRDPADRRRHLVELTAGRAGGAVKRAREATEAGRAASCSAPLSADERARVPRHAGPARGPHLRPRRARARHGAEPASSASTRLDRRRLLGLFQPYRLAARRRSSA